MATPDPKVNTQTLTPPRRSPRNLQAKAVKMSDDSLLTMATPVRQHKRKTDAALVTPPSSTKKSKHRGDDMAVITTPEITLPIHQHRMDTTPPSATRTLQNMTEASGDTTALVETYLTELLEVKRSPSKKASKRSGTPYGISSFDGSADVFTSLDSSIENIVGGHFLYNGPADISTDWTTPGSEKIFGSVAPASDPPTEVASEKISSLKFASAVLNSFGTPSNVAAVKDKAKENEKPSAPIKKSIKIIGKYAIVQQAGVMHREYERMKMKANLVRIWKQRSDGIYMKSVDGSWEKYFVKFYLDKFQDEDVLEHMSICMDPGLHQEFKTAVAYYTRQKAEREARERAQAMAPGLVVFTIEDGGERYFKTYPQKLAEPEVEVVTDEQRDSPVKDEDEDEGATLANENANENGVATADLTTACSEAAKTQRAVKQAASKKQPEYDELMDIDTDLCFDHESDSDYNDDSNSPNSSSGSSPYGTDTD